MKVGDLMIDDMTQMLDLGMFSEFEKTIMQENKIEFSKAIGKMLKASRSAAKLTKCYYCDNEITSFCNSHSVPAFCLKNISVDGKLGTLNSLIEFPLVDNDKGVKQAGTFQLICRDCDSKIFSDYENPENYDKVPTSKMIAQIALKNNLKFISKRLIETEMYNYMSQNQNFPEHLKMAKQYVTDLDLKEYIDGFKKAKRAIEKGWDDQYYLCYYKKLDYVVPIAFQSCISLTVGFDGEIINDIYNPSPKYVIKPIHICILPLENESVIMMFVDNGDTRYRKFYKTFNSLELEEQLLTLVYIMFAYSEEVYFSPNIHKKAKESSALINTSQLGQDIVSLTPKFNPLEMLKKNFDLSQRKRIPNFLQQEYKIR